MIIVGQWLSPRSQRTREGKYHLIRDISLRGDVTVTKIATADNLVDPFKKALPHEAFKRHLDSLGLRCSSNEL